MFKHKTDSVHYHETVAEARACHDSIFALCEHGMSLDLCAGPQHYPYDEDESTFGGYYNSAPLTAQEKAHWLNSDPDYPAPVMTEQQMWEAGEPVMTHFQGSIPTGDGMWVRAGHDTPCVCSVYDKCKPQRRADVAWTGNWRDMFRAYND